MLVVTYSEARQTFASILDRAGMDRYFACPRSQAAIHLSVKLFLLRHFLWVSFRPPLKICGLPVMSVLGSDPKVYELELSITCKPSSPDRGVVAKRENLDLWSGFSRFRTRGACVWQVEVCGNLRTVSAL